MVATNEQQPIVGFRELFIALLVDVLVIARAIEAKATVTSHDNQRVCHTVLVAALENQLREVAVNITTHNDTLCLGELEHQFLDYSFVIHSNTHD